MITKIYKIFGEDGHRQRASFARSLAFISGDGCCVAVYNSDMTQSNDFSVIVITAKDAETCEKELNGQLSDGVFENCRYGRVEEISFSEIGGK